MDTTTENSAIFSLEMLTKPAPIAAEPEEAPAVSMPSVFVPVLATSAVEVEEERPRVRGWVFVVALIAMIAPIAAVVVVATRTHTPARTREIATSTSTAAMTTVVGPETPTAAIATTTASSSSRNHHKPPKAIATTTATVKAHEAPKCCPGETEMQCAMRRSVGAACG